MNGPTRNGERPAPRPLHAPDVKDLLTSGALTACHYASHPTDHTARPDCQGLAVVRYGPIALCADCDTRRSAVGKGTAPANLAAPATLVRIGPAKAALADAEAALAATVAEARSAGHPWSAIAAALGVSRQAAQQRYAHAVHSHPPR